MGLQHGTACSLELHAAWDHKHGGLLGNLSCTNGSAPAVGLAGTSPSPLVELFAVSAAIQTKSC